MADLGSPSDWQLNGEGNANLVFAYTGSNPRLVGRVLRVRKPRPSAAPAQAALEEAVWAPALGPLASSAHSSSQGAETLAAAAAAAAEREQRYVQQLLAPLLGRHHIPPQQLVQPSPSFLQQLLSNRRACGTSDAQAAAVAGPAALMPDVTLLPGAQQQALQEQQEQQERQERQQPGQPVGPVVCVELKPKCGFVTSCCTVHPSNRGLKHSTSRYQLHQLLKLSQGKIEACSAYDPCDLFSGDPARVRCALSALLEQPQNNLLLFVDGQRQELLGQKRCKVQQAQQAQQAGQQDTPFFEQLLGGLLPLPSEQRRAALAELLAAILDREGVLPRLLQAQQQCMYDIEGIYQLYCHLVGLHPEDAAARPAACSNGNGSNNGNSSSVGSGIGSSGEDATCSDGQAVAVAQLLALPEAEAHAVLRSYVISATAKDCAVMIALQRLEGPPPAAASKEPASAAAGAAAAVGALGSSAACSSGTVMQQLFEEQQHRWSGIPSSIFSPSLYAGKQLRSGGSSGKAAAASDNGMGAGCWFRYRLCFVDLDIKPLAKIPAHAELDQRIMAAAKRHLGAAGDGTDVP